MPKKPASPLSVETKEYLVFDPSDVKKTVEIVEKAKPAREDLEIIEKKGKIPKKKKATAVKKKVHALSKERDESARLSGKYILIITEKPQAAAKIAAALSNGNDRKVSNSSSVSYYELMRNGKKIIVACAVGHLFTVSQTSKGTNYPQFNIGWFPNFEVNKKDFTKKYYMVIKKLAGEASELVIATDFDVEGEVIGYNIMRFIAERSDAKRMKFSSLTSQELQESFDNLRPSIEWGQAIAGETRHFVDWLYGINLSRAIMQAIKRTGKFKLMSIGRVQGPALKLIVDKEKEIQQFKSSLYWQVFATINDGKNTLELKYVKDITKKEELKKFDDLIGQKTLVTTTKTKQTLLPPAPFDLSSLQTEAYRFYSLTPAQTLATAQKLYLAGLISYPRTSSQKIPDVMKPLDILKKLKNHFEQTAHAIRIKPVEGNKTDPAHPAIIPTGNFSHLEGADKKLYELIVKRFIGCFCDNAELENKKVEISPSVGKFSARGMGILKKGWLSVYSTKMDEKEIPDFTGEVSITNTKIEEKETQPPRRYSPASIVSELEKRNLGTKATRANIIETLFSRNYVTERSMQATDLGIQLITSLEKHSPIIINEQLTREIEKEMENIRASKNDLEKKGDEVLKKTRDILEKISVDFKKNEQIIGKELVEAHQSIIAKEKIDNTLAIACPNCKDGKLGIKFAPRFRSYFIGCSTYPDCRQTYPLPHALIKNDVHKNCPACHWPLLLSIKKGKRPWIFCFNPACPNRKKMAEEKNSDDESDDQEEN